jgi:hypothetical protein
MPLPAGKQAMRTTRKPIRDRMERKVSLKSVRALLSQRVGVAPEECWPAKRVRPILPSVALRARPWLAGSAIVPIVLVASAAAFGSSRVQVSTYKQTLMDRCLQKHHVAFGYNFGPLGPVPLLHLSGDKAVTGTVGLFSVAQGNGMVVLGDGLLVFTKSASVAKADERSLLKRFSIVPGEQARVFGNVVALWPPRGASPTKPTLLACFRASAG